MSRYTLTIIVGAMVAARCGFAQSAPSPHAAHHDQAQMKIAADGSKNPELIPDALAFDNWFIAVAESPSATSSEAARQSAKLSPLRLSAQDRLAVAASLADFKVQFDAITLQRQQLAATVNAGGQAGTVWASLRASEDSLVAATRAELAATLSAAGVLAVNQWVLVHVKQHIVIYGELP
jgi:hypothetical protein